MKKLLKKNKKLFVLVIFILAFIFIPLTYSLGRFTYVELRNFYLGTKSFYFNADKLSDRVMNYQIDNWSGVDSYPITIYMNSYKNNDVYADSDITYDISYECSNGIVCSSDKSTSMISSQTHSDSFTVTLTPNTTFNDGDTAWIKVTATATSPYTKTISGKIILKIGHMGLSYEIVDQANRTYFDVNITNTWDTYKVNEAFSGYTLGSEMDLNTYLSLSDIDKAKCYSVKITITFDPNIVILDMTTPAMLRAMSTGTTTIDDYSYINSVTFGMDALSSESVRFYKKNIQNDYSYSGNGTPIVTVTFN